MDMHHLIHMANRIGKFWAPRMRHLLLAQIDAGGAPTLALQAEPGHPC